MYTHKNYGRAGYVDDPLPNIVHIAIWDACLHCVALRCTQLTMWWFPDNFFLLSVWSPCYQLSRKKKKI
jgi:hypothetical protein